MKFEITKQEVVQFTDKLLYDINRYCPQSHDDYKNGIVDGIVLLRRHILLELDRKEALSNAE